MKFLFSYIILFVFSFGNALYLDNYKQIEKQFIREYPNKKIAEKYVEKLNNNNIFQQALRGLHFNKKKFYKNNKSYIKPDVDKFFTELLKIKSNPAASYIATQFFILVYGLKNKEKINKFLEKFSKILYKNNMCVGYLFYGDVLRLNFKYLESKNIYLKGKERCKIPWLRVYIIGRLLKYY